MSYQYSNKQNVTAVDHVEGEMADIQLSYLRSRSIPLWVVVKMSAIILFLSPEVKQQRSSQRGGKEYFAKPAAPSRDPDSAQWSHIISDKYLTFREGGRLEQFMATGYPRCARAIPHKSSHGSGIEWRLTAGNRSRCSLN